MHRTSTEVTISRAVPNRAGGNFPDQTSRTTDLPRPGLTRHYESLPD